MEENPIYIVLDEIEKTTFMDVMYRKEKSVDMGNDNMQDTQLFYVYTSKDNLKLAEKNKQKMADMLIDYINKEWEVL